MGRPSVGLVIADTESYQLANNAVQACIDRFEFSSVNIFTDATNYWPQFNCFKIRKINGIDDYNEIIINEIRARVNDDYCIVAQYDGFILNGKAFRENYFSYDYIGAVWPNYQYFKVGNGGFSWRSRRLIEAVAELAHLRSPGEAEDLFICRTMRMVLEQKYHCRFASEEVANSFSYEIVPESLGAFGFHGAFNLPLVYRDNLQFLLENMPKRLLISKLPYLQYGARQLGQVGLEEFEMTISRILSE
jgi:hypothetical protein